MVGLTQMRRSLRERPDKIQNEVAAVSSIEAETGSSFDPS
jgi:hypothetical protein